MDSLHAGPYDGLEMMSVHLRADMSVSALSYYYHDKRETVLKPIASIYLREVC